MERSRSTIGVVLGLMVAGAFATAALATPLVDSAALNLRVFNDDPNSTLTNSNLYPGQIWIQDENFTSGGFANLHNFRLSANGGISAVNFLNGDAFGFFSDVTISGTGSGEGGLNVSPWWSQNVDGQFHIRTTDGEIAAFGGRLPFYSFTGTQGLHYTLGDTVRMGVIYQPNGLSALSPGTIEYRITMNSITYSSGALAFDEGNAAEGFGTWGMLDNAQIGGYAQPYIAGGGSFRVTFGNMSFVPEPAALTLLGLAGACLLRRGR
jgi:hypothetical protein